MMNTNNTRGTMSPVLLGKYSKRFFNKSLFKNWFQKNELLTQSELNHHVHIVGASGYGKSVLISHIMKNQILNGHGVLYIDLKGDRQTLASFYGYAKEARRETQLQLFALADLPKPFTSSSYNLLGNGSALEIRDRIMTSLTWSEEFYKNQAASFLLKLLIPACYMRDSQNLKLDFELLLKLISSPQEIERIALLIPKTRTHEKSLIEACFQFLRETGNYNSLQGLRAQIEGIALNDYVRSTCLGGTDNTAPHGECEINLFDSYTTGKINLIFLDTRRFGETAKVIGKLILQDLKSLGARVDSELDKSGRRPFTVIIDEFSDLAQDDFLAFLDRARSAKIQVVIAHQELSDLKRVSPEFSARLTGNTSTMYSFLQKNPESAEMISGMAGTRTVQKETIQTEKFLFMDIPSGMKSVRDTEEYIVHPNIIKSLPVGRCVSIKKFPYSRAHVVEIDPSD